mmetsp:Transcript_31939/g.78362  ORF Transcript_31939/g.78362 Transcript_31939/m.78362 type:complete len:233 (+) Transcript_31939:97-795(+)
MDCRNPPLEVLQQPCSNVCGRRTRISIQPQCLDQSPLLIRVELPAKLSADSQQSVVEVSVGGPRCGGTRLGLISCTACAGFAVQPLFGLANHPRHGVSVRHNGFLHGLYVLLVEGIDVFITVVVSVLQHLNMLPPSHEDLVLNPNVQNKRPIPPWCVSHRDDDVRRILWTQLQGEGRRDVSILSEGSQSEEVALLHTRPLFPHDGLLGNSEAYSILILPKCCCLTLHTAVLL